MKPIKLPINEIIKKIWAEETFEATPKCGGFILKIDKYVPYCCTAIHNGGQLRKELKTKIALNDYERWYEEDPHTADFISSMPITFVGLDSRFEYDLNRSPQHCIYDEAWDKKVWKKNLSASDVKLSKEKHAAYYKVLGALIGKLESLFGGCVVYDFHSYNYKRWNREAPLFNIGTEKLKKEKYRPYIENWLSELSAINLHEIPVTASENDVFFGRGYNLEFINENSNNTLVLATEVKKVFCDELNGDDFPKVIRQLQQRLKKAILTNANYFSKDLKNWKHTSPPNLLNQQIDDSILSVDKALYKYLRHFELIPTVSPLISNPRRGNFSGIGVLNYLSLSINQYG